jgi:hypothetical protein
MATESAYVAIAMEVARRLLPKPFEIERGAALLYQVTVDNHLATTVDVKHPRRGNAAFQTDLCVFERKTETVAIPRVVLEFKTAITTHDVITYSAKASKHKQVYPYLRYGIVASAHAAVPGRLFTHNQSLDFCAAVSGLKGRKRREFFAFLLTSEVKASQRLEAIAFEDVRTRLFRNEVVLYSPPPG